MFSVPYDPFCRGKVWIQFCISEMAIRIQYEHTGPGPPILAALLVLYTQANWVGENPAFLSQMASCLRCLCSV